MSWGSNDSPSLSLRRNTRAADRSWLRQLVNILLFHVCSINWRGGERGERRKGGRGERERGIRERVKERE